MTVKLDAMAVKDDQEKKEKKRTTGARLTKSSGPSITGEGDGKIGGDFVLQANPGFISARIAVYDRIMEKQRAAINGTFVLCLTMFVITMY